jgi:hypothetical protein
MITPPRTAELLLESLGVRSTFHEALLGDLAEEFALRVERDGVAPARRWYYRESVRVAPHLLRAWGRGLHARDLRRLASLVFASYCFTIMLIFLGTMVAGSVADLFGSPRGLAPHRSPALWLSVGGVCTLTAGYIAAWLDSRAPLANTVALGVAWSCVGLAGAVTGGNALPGAYRVCLLIMLFVGPPLGGVLRVCALGSIGPEERVASVNAAQPRSLG